MAIKKKKSKAKKGKVGVDFTLWDVILSFPDLHEPKPYKGNTYYRLDALMDEDHPQLAELRKLIFKVRKDAFGADKDEWPDDCKRKLLKDGNEREDIKGYKDRFSITPSTKNPVPVVDLKGKNFPAQSVRGGMFGNVAIRISEWENEGEGGVSIYLQGVMVDTKKKSLNFGGGKSVQQMFKLDAKSEEEEEEDTPRGKKKPKKKSWDDSEEE
jgi:hypothetical protein